MKLFSGLTSKITDETKAKTRIAAGICIAIFTLFTLLSVVSFLFTWKQDQSLMTDPSMMAKSVDAANLCGKMGLRWSWLLVHNWFGLGSIAFVVILFALSVRLLTGQWKQSLMKTAILTLSGAFVASLVCAFIGQMFGAVGAFGAGAGGQCGQFVVDSLGNLVGPFIAGALICALVVFWLFLCSDRFAQIVNGWFISLGAEDPQTMEPTPAVNTAVAEEPVETPAPQEEVFDDVDDYIEPAVAHQSVVWDTPTVVEPEEVSAPCREEVVETPAAPVYQTPVYQTPSYQPAAEETPATEGSFSVEMGKDLDLDAKEPLPRMDVRMDPPEGLPKYQFPTLDLLEDHDSGREDVSAEELDRNNNKIRCALRNYGIEVDDVRAIVGPTVTLYKVYPAQGVKISAIKNRHEDIAMSLHARGVRIVNLPDSVGIEVANDKASTVPLKGLLNSEAFRTTSAELPVAIGCNIQKKVRVFDLADAPHLLVAGATKQGKSVGLNVLIASLLYAKHPAEMKMVFIDPKMVEFSPYERLIHHYLAVLPDAADEQDEMSKAIVKQPKHAERILKSLCIEMDQRYELLSKAYVNKITLYNEKYKDHKLNPQHGHRFMPYIVCIIDEYADLAMSGGSGSEGKAMKKNIMDSIVRLAQKGRAAGIHVVIATQRPSVDVITGLIKANFPARIAFRVTTGVDSKTILDQAGAEKLIGRGDMLYYAGVESERIQCGYISNDEINALSEWVFSQQGYGKSYNTPYYLPEPDPEGEGESVGMVDMKDLDERFEEAAKLVVMTQKGSTSDLQRKLGMGYAKAGRVMDQLEAAGIVGPQEGSKPRQVLVSSLEELEAIIKPFLNY